MLISFRFASILMKIKVKLRSLETVWKGKLQLDSSPGDGRVVEEGWKMLCVKDFCFLHTMPQQHRVSLMCAVVGPSSHGCSLVGVIAFDSSMFCACGCRSNYEQIINLVLAFVWYGSVLGIFIIGIGITMVSSYGIGLDITMIHGSFFAITMVLTWRLPWYMCLWYWHSHGIFLWYSLGELLRIFWKILVGEY